MEDEHKYCSSGEEELTEEIEKNAPHVVPMISKIWLEIGYKALKIDRTRLGLCPAVDAKS